MKRRQLTLSLSLLLLGGLCVNTSIQAQSGGEGQISVQVVGSLNPGGTNSLVISPANEFTWQDLKNLSQKEAEIFDLFEVNIEDGTAIFSLVDMGNQNVPAAKVEAYIAAYLNEHLTIRQDAGIERGPIAVPAMAPTDAMVVDPNYPKEGANKQ